MSGTTQELGRKIASAGDLQAIVRSMKALAASSIGQYEKAVRSLDDYYRTVELGLAACLRQAGPTALAAASKPRRSAPVAAVIFGSDQGLVGRFNEVLAESALRTLRALRGKTTTVWAVGERMHALLAGSGLPPARLLPAANSVKAITALVGRILVEIEAARARGDVVEVYLFHHHPSVGDIYEPASKRLLPLDKIWYSRLAALPWPSGSLPEVLGGAEAVLPALIREYLFVLLFQACAESLASENASRLAAMQRAEKNIEDILEQMQRQFHRIRQESIDEELFDVISGYDALAQGRHEPRGA
jgi:F-type H+-transporting ATPase subunit gamma